MGVEYVEHVRRGFHHILPSGPDPQAALRVHGRGPGHLLRRYYILVLKDIEYIGC